MIPPYVQQSQFNEVLCCFGSKMFGGSVIQCLGSGRGRRKWRKNRIKIGVDFINFVNVADSGKKTFFKKEYKARETTCPQGGSLTPNEADPTVGIYGRPLTLKVHVTLLKEDLEKG